MKDRTLGLRTALCLCLIFTAGFLPAYSQQIEKGLTASNGDYLGFLEYKPADYDQQTSTKYPIIIFLHGIGERGDGRGELKNVACCGIPRIIKYGHKMRFTWNGKTETFLVLSPQCPKKYGMWPTLFVDELIGYAKQNLRIDTNRIFLSGLSMGGGGSYKYLSSSSAGPTHFAASATICAPCTFSNGSYVAKANLPVWSFHAADDKIVSYTCTEEAIKKINGQSPAVKPLKTIWPTGGHLVWDRVYTDTSYKFDGVLNIYEWFLGQNKTLPVNTLPVARAGSDLIVASSAGMATLNASASSDADGSLVRYVWKKLSGPSAGVISTCMGAASSTTVTGLSVAGTYQYQLAVVDNRAGFALDTVTVTVSAVAPLPNKIPVAKAGIDLSVTLPVDSAVLDGHASLDEDGRLVNYIWSQVEGPSVSMTRNDTAAMRLSGLVKGLYRFKLTVTDDKGGTAIDEIMIEVRPALVPLPPVPDTIVVPPVIIDTIVVVPPVIIDTIVALPPVIPDTPVVVTPPQVLPPPNQAPLAKAGPDKLIQLLYTEKVRLDANASRDVDGWIRAFEWTKVSGPDSCTFENSHTGNTLVLGLKPGVYTFGVAVTDNKGAVSFDTAVVTVIAAPVNILPLAIAGPDKTVLLDRMNFCRINATASKDPDGWIRAFEWVKVSGPDTFAIGNALTGNTVLTGLVPGTYIFRVLVTDNRGGVTGDNLKIIVAKNEEELEAMMNVVSQSSVLSEEMAGPVVKGVKISSAKAYPNPASSLVMIDYGSEVSGQSVMMIYDVRGVVARSIPFFKGTGVHRQRVDVTGLKNGLYYVKVVTGNKAVMNTRFVKK